MSAPATTDRPAHRVSNVRVYSQNLFGRRGDWTRRRAVLIAGLRDLRPDLVAFQKAIVNDHYDQVLDLLGPDYFVTHQTAREAAQGEDVEEGQGFSVASRWPLGEVHELDLHVSPRTADFACGTLVAEVLAPEPVGTMLLVYHNPSWKLQLEYERELQAVAAARFVEEIIAGRDVHVVLVGDLEAAQIRRVFGFGPAARLWAT